MDDWGWLEKIEEELRFSLMASTDCENADHFQQFTPQLIKALRLAKEALEKARNAADNGYKDLDLNFSVITIDDDDFYDCVGYPRDLIDQTLSKLAKGEFE